MKKRNLAGLLAGVLAMSSLAGCAAPAEDLMKNVTPNPVFSGEEVELNHVSATDFAVRLFQNSLKEGENTLISPLSVMTALAMTANGARGETLAQMEAVLGLTSAELNTWQNRYAADLPAEERIRFRLANSVWFADKESFTVNEDFLQTNADYYGAGIYKAPFDNSTKDAINDWVKDNTDGMIQNILDEIPEEAVMYLVNALAFEAEWQDIYSQWDIAEAEFTAEDGRTLFVDMMYSDEYSYLEDDLASGFLKYYAGRQYAFAALLPDTGITVGEYAASLTGEGLYHMLTDASPVCVKAGIPKFEMEYDVEMSDILKEMGMPAAFEPSADFSGLGTSTLGPLYLNRVLHKTYICVDEKGTKAGASTVVEVVEETAMEPAEEPKQVILDRPFVYMLIDCETMLPFFIGTIMDPVS